MKRRRLVVAVGLVGAVGTATAQATGKVYRIGILATLLPAAEMAGPQTRSSPINALLRGLRAAGYVYGEQFVTEVRSSEGKLDRLPGLAAELVALKVDLIVAAGPALPALKAATSTIPVVMTGSGDPVGQGFVQSLARPGGNFTGLTLQSVDTVGKRLELLGEVVRAAGPIAVLWDRYNLLQWQEAEAAAKLRRWNLLSLEVRALAQMVTSFAAVRDARASGLLVFNSALFDREAARVAALAAKARLPAIYGLRLYVDAGGLMSYGPDLVENWRRAGIFVDKILKGAQPADLPVEQPTKFELVINLKAAHAQGMVMPRSLLLRADDVVH
jgi:putative ABC transport system substrate-binding protein